MATNDTGRKKRGYRKIRPPRPSMTESLEHLSMRQIKNYPTCAARAAIMGVVIAILFWIAFVVLTQPFC